MTYDESSDILGGRLPVSPKPSASLADPGQIALLFGLALVAGAAWVYIVPFYRQWSETRYKKAMRRRHGIPDDDHRPFNVAYAAATQRNRKEETRKGLLAGGTGPRAAVDEQRVPAFQTVPRTAPYPTPILRHPANEEWAPGPSTFSARTPQPQHSRSDRHDEASAASRPSESSSGRSSRASGKRPVHTTGAIRRKHSLQEDVEDDPHTRAKKSRIESDETDDEDDEMQHSNSDEDMEVDTAPVHRGSKRVASDEDDDDLERQLDKKARRGTLGESRDDPDDDEVMEEEDSLDVAEPSRGKKRDRAEAGSTFGGDDSVVDESEKPQPRRRRKVSGKHGQHSRGQKRGRDLHSVTSDEEDEPERPVRSSTRKKRGKRSSDAGLDSVGISNDPLCKGRRIGQEWVVDDVRYKVGPNGQRLRQALVKKSRTRYPMPKDSFHPDRQASVDIYVETWLSEEEYKDAKERDELASPPQSEPQSPGDVDTPFKPGKSLLWASTASRESPAPKRAAFGHSVITNVGLHLNAFPKSQSFPNRRISSIAPASPSPAPETPKITKSRSYSKWEKQDLEAEAMSKIRSRMQKEETKSAPSISGSRPASNTPDIFGSKAEDKKTQPSGPSFSFPTSSGSAPAKPAGMEMPTKLDIPKPAPSSETPKPPVPTFSFTPAPSTTPASGSAPTPPVTAATTSQPSAAPASSIPNFFAKPASQPAPAAPTPNPPQTKGPEPPKIFSFAAPTPPANAAAPENKATEQTAQGGASLLSRLGNGPPPSANSSFSFAKPASTTPPAAPAPAPAAAGGTAPLKFDFKIGKPSSAPTSTPTSAFAAATPSATPSNPFQNGATANGTNAAPKSAFSGFGSSTTPAASPFGGSTTPASTTPASNVFGGSTTPAANGSGGSSTPSVNPFGGSSTPATNPFGGSSTTPATNPFGGSSTPATNIFGSSSTPAASPFGATSNSIFGGSNNNASAAAPASSTPASNPPSVFGGSTASTTNGTSFFGNTASTTPKPDAPFAPPASSTPATTTAKTTFSFAPLAPAPAANGTDGKLTFSFAAPKTGTETKPTFGFGTTPGATPTPAAFGFGAPTSSTPAAGTAAASPFGASQPNAFGTAGKTSGAFGSTPSTGAFQGFGLGTNATNTASNAGQK